MDISDPETDNETLRPVYKISVCSCCKHRFIPKLKKNGETFTKHVKIAEKPKIFTDLKIEFKFISELYI